MDRENGNPIWSRRTGNRAGPTNDSDDSLPAKGLPKRSFGGQDGARASTSNNPFNSVAPLSTAGISSPTAGASSAFGLGSGAFASFGSATRTPKTPGTAFDFLNNNLEKKDKDAEPRPTTASKKSQSNLKSSRNEDNTNTSSGPALKANARAPKQHPLRYSWIIHYRPPAGKTSDYEKSIQAMCRMSTVEEFWKVYIRLKSPSTLPVVSDFHFFKEGIRPVWEDEENCKGGKWVIRLKKGVADRYWEELLMAMIGDQFNEASDEVCGAVLSVRSGEDVLAVWTKNDGGRNVKIRETIKRVLNLPADTIIVWKSHDDSIAQRSAIDQARQDQKPAQGDKRRTTLGSQDASGVVGLGVKSAERPKGSG